MANNKINKISLSLICCAAAFAVGATLLVVISNIKDPVYTVKFETNGGTKVDTQKIKKGNIISEPFTYKKGYEIETWEDDVKEWDFENDVVNSDMTLYVEWKAIKYSIVYDYGQGIIGLDANPSSYTIEDEIDLLGPFLINGTFKHYIDQNGYTYKKIERGTTGDLVLTAVYTPLE